jgi:hypothetical protein
VKKGLSEIEAETARFLRGEDRANVEHLCCCLREALDLIHRAPGEHESRAWLTDAFRLAKKIESGA